MSCTVCIYTKATSLLEWVIWLFKIYSWICKHCHLDAVNQHMGYMFLHVSTCKLVNTDLRVPECVKNYWRGKSAYGLHVPTWAFWTCRLSLWVQYWPMCAWICKKCCLGWCSKLAYGLQVSTWAMWTCHFVRLGLTLTFMYIVTVFTKGCQKWDFHIFELFSLFAF